jgi:hypothetical protein
MYIKKKTSNVVHRGYTAGGIYGRPTWCRQPGYKEEWYNVNPEVIEGIRKGSVKHLRLCKKCFKE